MLDGDLLKLFVSTGSQEAFAEIVRRHMDAVYAAARRQVHEGQLAEDVAQAVFIILARKAAKLQNRDSLAGWLIKTTNLASRDAIKMESRRRHHEQRAAFLAQPSLEQSMTPELEAISPELDRALLRLSESDRSAVTLRYLEEKSVVETAASLGISEAAATKRVFRAIERLRKILLRKHVITPAVSLAVVLEQIPRVSAPAALAGNVAATAGSATPATLAIVKGVIYMMTWHKLVATLMVLIALATATGIGIGTAKLLADQNDSPVPQPVPSQPNPATEQPSTFVGQLSNGPSFEILGLSESPSAGKTWWAADGEVLAHSLVSSVPAAQMSAGGLARNLNVRFDSSVRGSAEPASVTWVVDDCTYVYSGEVTKGGENAMTIGVHDNLDGAMLHAFFAAGPWTTVSRSQGFGQASERGLTGSFMFSSVFSKNGQTHIVVGYSGLRKPVIHQVGDPNSGVITANDLDPDLRLVAVDRGGKQVVATAVSSVSDATGRMGEYSVRLPQSSISEWQLQIRPYDQWIEFRHISLHGGQKTVVQILTSDDKK